MTLITRYIAHTIFASTALVLLILLGLYTFIDFVTELEDLGQGQYGLLEIGRYIGMTMPKRIYELLPIAALLGSVLGLGTLASQNELVVMRTAGLSIGQINRGVMVAAILLFAIAFVVGEGIRPLTEQKAINAQNFAQKGVLPKVLQRGFWLRDGTDFSYVGQFSESGTLQDIIEYQFDKEQRLVVVTHAETANYAQDRWLLSKIKQSTLTATDITTINRASQEWETGFKPDKLSVVAVEPEYLPIWKLPAYIAYLTENQQKPVRHQVALWKKIMMPLSAAVMVFLAVPFIFGPLRSSAIGGRILVGALAGLGFYLFNQIFQHMGVVFGLWPFISAALPTLGFAVLAWYLTYRL